MKTSQNLTHQPEKLKSPDISVIPIESTRDPAEQTSNLFFDQQTEYIDLDNVLQNQDKGIPLSCTHSSFEFEF